MDVVFSKHALERMDQRAVSKEMVLQAIHNPDRSYPEADGDTKFIRKVYGSKVHVVCKPLLEENKWLVKSVWIRGENDNQSPAYRRKQAVQGFIWLGVAIVIAVVLIYLISR